ncbi:hypothetical protein [Isoptericola sp. NPDC060257]|uniref:hypothetical protein n=1 Tax=Isoptericola sp. NPDC060257 TaxID=3347087 RepID=UPI00366353E4
MFTQQSSYATAELRSTTGTAPIKFQRNGGEDVLVTLEDGSAQLYDRRNLLLAVLGFYEDDGEPTAEQMVVVARALGLRGAEVVPDEPWRITWAPPLDGIPDDIPLDSPDAFTGISWDDPSTWPSDARLDG